MRRVRETKPGNLVLLTEEFDWRGEEGFFFLFYKTYRLSTEQNTIEIYKSQTSPPLLKYG